MIPIAASELRMLVRNRLVAFCAILIPLALGAVFIINRPPEGGLAFASTLQLVVMLGMGVYVTATTTLAARRQNLFLKRMRSGSVSDAAIVVGLVGPIVLVSIVQVAVILIGLSIAGETVPVHGWLLVTVVLLVELMFAGFALATAGVTNSPEHAQVTTLPIFFVALGVPFWVLLTGTDELGWLKQSLPGGALPQLMNLVWYGGDLSRVAILLAPTVAWAAIAVVVARVMFRWEPRS